MRKILTPTDFGIPSLQLLESVAILFPNEMVNILLIYPYKIQTWATEPYRFSESKIISDLMNGKFYSALEEIKNRNFRHINAVEMKLLIGSNSFAFQNFRDHNRVHNAILPRYDSFNFSKSYSFNPISLIEKNIKNVHWVHPLGKNEAQTTKGKAFFKMMLNSQG